jgi:chemotaxis protein MotB
MSALCGCQFVPKTQFSAAETRVRTLTEQNKALLAEIENRKQHVQHMEERVRRAEEDLALFEEQMGLDRGRLARSDRSVGARSSNWPAGISTRLADLAARYPALRFDPVTGVAKFDTDVLFDTGDDRFLPESQQVLAEFAQIFQETNAHDLKIMIVGHTDDRGVAKKPTRERFANNWELSTARALAVANFLRQSGVPEERMGVVGFAGYQPLAANASDEDRLRNRRVEIFVMGPETPVVGWSDGAKSVFR